MCTEYLNIQNNNNNNNSEHYYLSASESGHIQQRIMKSKKMDIAFRKKRNVSLSRRWMTVLLKHLSFQPCVAFARWLTKESLSFF